MIKKNHPPRIDLMVLLAALILAAWVTWAVGPKTYDDAYITFRYARNLALGHGFVYNPGDNILGTTTPLLTLLLALLGRIFSVDAIPAIGQAISGAALFFCGALAYLLGKTNGQRLAGVIAGLAMLINPILIDTWGTVIICRTYAVHVISRSEATRNP
jgi:4-amino-4-deoxy-L-arabinose transferase-like glycosyltransferase